MSAANLNLSNPTINLALIKVFSILANIEKLE